MRFSAAAVAAILDAVHSEANFLKDNDLVPGIGWSLNRNDDWANAGPSLGFVERAKVARAAPMQCGDIELYNNLPAELSRKYEEATLDFFDGQLNFRPS